MILPLKDEREHAIWAHAEKHGQKKVAKDLFRVYFDSEKNFLQKLKTEAYSKYHATKKGTRAEARLEGFMEGLAVAMNVFESLGEPKDTYAKMYNKTVKL